MFLLRLGPIPASQRFRAWRHRSTWFTVLKHT